MTRREFTVVVAGLALFCSVAPGTAQDDVTQEEAQAFEQSAPTAAERDALLGPPAGPPLTGDALLQRTEEVALLMRCPVCQGLSIGDSPTLLAQAMKSEVGALLAEGYSEEQVMLYFEQSYGEFIRLAPKARGFNLLVWLAPVAALALGAWFVFARARSPKPAVEEARQAEVDDPEIEAYRKRVRQELAAEPGDDTGKETTK